MIGFNINQAKSMFFNQKLVKNAADRATLRVLSRFGAYVRRTARRSIRKRKRAARSGQPPSSHTGLLKRFIFFVYDRTKRSVIVGPARLGGKVGAAPEALEYGGRSQTISRGERRSVFVQPHPFMQPAFEAEKPKLPDMWRDSIT
jgi:hypothetical protein